MQEYKIVNSQDKFKLETEINQMLKDGWKCKGGMIIQDSHLGPAMMFQTMVRNTERHVL